MAKRNEKTDIPSIADVGAVDVLGSGELDEQVGVKRFGPQGRWIALRDEHGVVYDFFGFPRTERTAGILDGTFTPVWRENERDGSTFVGGLQLMVAQAEATFGRGDRRRTVQFGEALPKRVGGRIVRVTQIVTLSPNEQDRANAEPWEAPAEPETADAKAEDDGDLS